MISPSEIFGEAMAELIEQSVGIDRCRRTLHTLFALELIELGKIEWRRRNDHEWEVGRWPGLQLRHLQLSSRLERGGLDALLPLNVSHVQESEVVF